MTRVISRAKKEFGVITRGTEEEYNPGLDYLEHEIYRIYTEIPITDYELREVIEMIIYDVKGIIDQIDYDYGKIRSEDQKKFAQTLELLFNPFLNKEIPIHNLDLEKKEDLKELFTLPIKCLLRIYDSIEFWNHNGGKNGYYRMLEEMVLPVIQIGKHPYVLEDEYIDLEKIKSSINS